MKTQNYIRDKRSPKPKSPQVSKVMSANKAKNTKPEMLLRKLLWQQGFRGYRLHYEKAPGKPDICFVKKKIAIFVHGCFWHRCPICKLSLPKTNISFWEKKFANNFVRDNAKIDELKRSGWRIIVVWECEINANPNSIVKNIQNIYTI